MIQVRAARNQNAVILHLVVLVVGATAGGLDVSRAGQESDYDLGNYHDYAGYAFLNDRLGLDYTPASLQTSFNRLRFVPLNVLAQHVRPMGVGVVCGCFHRLALAIVLAIAVRLLAGLGARERIVVSLLAAVAGVYGPVLMGSLRSSSHDALLNPSFSARCY